MSSAPDRCDVAVVGLGPVGAVLANLLGQHGHDVVVLERWPSAYPLPRAVHFDGEIARILQACGIGDTLPDITEAPDRYEWRNAAGDTLLRFALAGAGRCGWPNGSMFNQPQLEALLAERLAALPSVDVRRGMEFVDADVDASGVTVSYRDREAGTDDVTTIETRYVVGCDGANSSVRDAIGVPVTDLGFFYDWFIVDVVLDDERKFVPTNLQICDPARPTTAVSGGPGRRRWEFMRLPSEPVEEFADEATAWRLLADWDVRPDNARLERHALYTFQARWVDEWRSGPILLAGDAAHQMPPFAGQGMCSGIRDAANLAWKLDHVMRGAAPDALLDTYGSERRPSVEQAINTSMELGKVICIDDADAAAERDRAMIPGAVGGRLAQLPPLPGIETGIRRADDAAAGELALQAVVERDGKAALLDDHLGVGWRLLTVDPSVPGSLGDELATWFAEIGGRTCVIGPRDDATGDVTDVDGAYAQWLDGLGVTTVLQRPDFSVYGSATDADGAVRLLADARTAVQTGQVVTSARRLA